MMVQLAGGKVVAKEWDICDLSKSSWSVVFVGLLDVLKIDAGEEDEIDLR
jgi:hypothetical protein